MTLVLGEHLRIKVPATSANLGPGFDTLGLSLALYDELEVEVNAEQNIRIAVEGYGSDYLPRDETNLIVRAAMYACNQLGMSLPGLDIVAHNQIPQGKGLGSSASAIVAGVMIARAVLDTTRRVSRSELFNFAYALEGHPDNIAPAFFGGLTIAWHDKGIAECKKLSFHRGIYPMVCVPEQELATHLSRGLKPDQVPYEDAVFNLSRSSLLVAALTQSPELLLTATEDRLHQDYRAEAMPQTQQLIAVLREQSLPAVLSGAGPSVLVLCNDPVQRQQVLDVLRQQFAGWKPLMLAVDVAGAHMRVE